MPSDYTVSDNVAQAGTRAIHFGAASLLYVIPDEISLNGNGMCSAGNRQSSSILKLN